MKHLLLTTIAAVLVVGCGPQPPDISIHDAVYDGNIEAVKQHLAAGTDVDAKDYDGMTPLHNAANEGHEEIAELLIAKGAEMNAKNKYGRTPLYRAANRGQKEIAELLITNGADVNAIDNFGETPLDPAIIGVTFVGPAEFGGFVRHSSHETAALLRKHGGKTSDWFNADKSIHTAASGGNIEAVKQHIAAGADVNAMRGGGGTPLSYAASWGHEEIVELLIANGADVNAKSGGGKTPLDLAIQSIPYPKGHPETIALLRKHGGKRGAELEAEGKPTESVAEATQPEPPTAKTPDASLWKATLFGEIEPAKQAIADGADVNAKDEDTGDTPLHRAVVAALDSGRNEVVELLIANGADVNAMGGTFGGTPLDITKRLSEAATLTKRLRELQGKTDDISVADLLRKHGGKTAKELRAEGK